MAPVLGLTEVTTALRKPQYRRNELRALRRVCWRLVSASSPCKDADFHKASNSSSVRTSRVSLRLLSIKSPPASMYTSPPPEATWLTHKLPEDCLSAMPRAAVAVMPPPAEFSVWMLSVDLTVPSALKLPMPPRGAEISTRLPDTCTLLGSTPMMSSSPNSQTLPVVETWLMRKAPPRL